MILLQAHSLTNTGWFSILSAPLTLAEKDSTLSFEIAPEAPELSPGQWLMDDEEPGRGIVWRVRSVAENYGTGIRTVTCEHIIQALKDTSIIGEATTGTLAGNPSAQTCTAQQAIQYALGLQSDWVLGAFGSDYAGVAQPYSFNGDTVLGAIETVCGTLEDCWWSYDLSVYPFRLNVQKRDMNMACEMREGRNISSIRRTIDAGGMYTRIYPIGKENLRLPEGYLSRNEGTYGVIMRVETDQSCETEGMLRAWAEGRLRRHCQPNVSIQISGVDLSRETGEPLDSLQLGRACRVPLPEYQTNILENIVKMQWRDKKKEPIAVTLTLSNTVADVATIVKQERSEGAGSSGRAGRYGAKKAEEDHAWFVDTTDHVSMVAEAIVGKTEEAVNWSRVAELTVDGQGIHGHVTQAEQDIIANQTAIEASERDISLTVKSRQIPSGSLHSYTSLADFPAAGQLGHYYYYETGSGSSAKRHYYYWNGENYVAVNVFTGRDGNLYGNYVNSGEIAIAINKDGNPEAHIDAQKVILGQSKLTADDLESWAKDPTNNGNGVFAKYFYAKKVTAQSVEATDSLEVGGIVSAGTGGWFGTATGNAYVWLYQGVVNAGSGVKINEGGTLEFSRGRDPAVQVTAAKMMNAIRKAEVNASTNELKLYTFMDADNAPSVTFSKATTLSGVWSGDNTTDTASFTVTAKQSSVSVGTESTSVKVKQSKTACWIAMNGGSGGKTDGEIIARIDNPQYGNGWAAAYGKVSLPTNANTSTASFDVSVPPAAVDGNATTETYTLSNPMNNVAVVKNSAGTIVCRLEHGQYSAGAASVTPSSPKLQSKDLTFSNGSTTTVSADAGYDGLSQVIVRVPKGRGMTGISLARGNYNSNSRTYTYSVQLSDQGQTCSAWI